LEPRGPDAFDNDAISEAGGFLWNGVRWIDQLVYKLYRLMEEEMKISVGKAEQ
jgi:hypothetical protein